MHKYVLSSKADIDLDEIADYSVQEWGEGQALKYLDGLIECFENIALTPDMGRDASEFSPYLKRFKYNAHSVFYTSTDKGVLIVRILSQKQDFGRHL